MTDATRERAEAWAHEDPDGETQEALLRALAEGNEVALQRMAGSTLQFGTAGLRGPVGPGPAQMNVLLVAKVSWALGAFLKGRGLQSRGVVVGYDARPESQRFAQMAASVLAGAGHTVWLSAEALPTPRIAHAVRYLRAGAGVVVTASHNPRGDNGFKVYDDEGIQIVAPWDTEVARLIDEAPTFSQIPRSPSGAVDIPAAVEEAYLAVIHQRSAEVLSLGRTPTPSVPLRIAYSAFHGVGKNTFLRAIESLGVELLVEPEQGEPDGTFPTLPFPNPEEPGATDRLLAFARVHQADLALCHDPDADRLFAALPGLEAGTWEPLSGDALGLLLADLVLEVRARLVPSEPSVVTSTVVSSPALKPLAEFWGARRMETLTGFKWLCRPALREPGFAFAYEEALGYCIGRGTNAEDLQPLDKDGISAGALLVAHLVRGGSASYLRTRLLDIYQRVGIRVSLGVSHRVLGGAGAQTEIMNRLRAAPPSELLGSPMTQVTDFLRASPSELPEGGRSDLLRWESQDGTVVLVRPSGTEPKVKIYLHLRAEFEQRENYAAAYGQLAARAKELAAEVMRLF